MNFGADDYLTKPVIREDLLAAVQTRLARSEMLTKTHSALKAKLLRRLSLGRGRRLRTANRKWRVFY